MADGELPFDPSLFTDPTAGRRKLNDMLGFDPFLGATPLAPKTELDPYYDVKMGTAWQIERDQGREAANRYLLDQGLQEFPEADGK